MKLNKDGAKLYGRVSGDLAEKIQPLIVAAVTQSGLDRNLVQSALLKELEGTHARIGLATAARLLKDPKALVEGYSETVAGVQARKQQNFDENLRLMVERVAKPHPVETMAELKKHFPASRDYKQLLVVAELHARNGGRPLTVVELPAALAGKEFAEAAKARCVGGKVVLIDGECVEFANEGIRGPMAKEDILQASQLRPGEVPDPSNGSGTYFEAPARPQMELPGLS
jgi:hypothetical protein